MRRLRSAILLSGCLIGMATAPGQVHAQWTVIDPSNLAQNIEQVRRAIEQINNQRLQIDYQLQALRKLDRVHWRDVSGVMREVDVLMRRQRAIAYSLADLDRQFRETFPGSQASPDDLAFAEAQRDQAERTLGTMGAGLQVLSEHARQIEDGQATLAAIKDQLRGVRGTQEALELQASLDAYVAEEIGMLRQTVATQANLQAVYNAYRVNQDAEMAANYMAMLARVPEAPLNSNRSFSLMMRSW
jgi:P-type conjugative transfer protein TrbJ